MENQPDQTKPVSRAMLIWTAVACVVVSAAFSLGASYYFFALKSTVPQVRFVNMAALVDVFNQRFTDESQKAEALRVLNANLNYLGNQGVVLFNTSSMVSAPSVLLINHEALIPPAPARAAEPKEKAEAEPEKPAAKK